MQLRKKDSLFIKRLIKASLKPQIRYIREINIERFKMACNMKYSWLLLHYLKLAFNANYLF